jgi:hypothetical protein
MNRTYQELYHSSNINPGGCAVVVGYTGKRKFPEHKGIYMPVLV